MAKKVQELSLREFAESVKPSGAVNRLPQLGQGQEVLVYQAYMNGDLAKELPEAVREHQFSDVIVHRLTEKLGLNPGNFRDNLKVAEVLAVRAAYMEAILRATAPHSLPEERVAISDVALAEYEKLTDGLNHPWIVEQIEAQKSRNQNLKPVMEQASALLGRQIVDRAPDELNKGEIVSGNAEFTVQSVGGGKVAIHENARLQTIPKIGDNVTITYYRGHGQVFDNTQDVQLSAPFLDPRNDDLAILATDLKTGKEQLVIFNSITGFSAFVQAQGLDPALVEKGMEVLASKPKAPPKERPERKPASEVTVDEKTGALSMDYLEGGIRYTAIFSSAKEMEGLAPEYGMAAGELDAGRRLENQIILFGGDKVAKIEKSLRAARGVAAGISDHAFMAIELNGRYTGPVVGETDLHIIQDLGRRSVVIHDKTKLDKVPAVGQKLSISYAGTGRAVVEIRSMRSGHDR